MDRLSYWNDKWKESVSYCFENDAKKLRFLFIEPETKELLMNSALKAANWLSSEDGWDMEFGLILETEEGNRYELLSDLDNLKNITLRVAQDYTGENMLDETEKGIITDIFIPLPLEKMINELDGKLTKTQDID